MQQELFFAQKLSANKKPLVQSGFFAKDYCFYDCQLRKTISHSIKKGLSFKPSFAFLFSLVKRLLIQLKNLVIMAIGLNDDKIFASGGQDCRAEFRLDDNSLEKQEKGMLTS